MEIEDIPEDCQEFNVFYVRKKIYIGLQSYSR